MTDHDTYPAALQLPAGVAQTDPRITAALSLAQARQHPYYAAAAYTLAWRCGDTAAMQRAIELGAQNYRRAPLVYAQTAADLSLDLGDAAPEQRGLWEVV